MGAQNMEKCFTEDFRESSLSPDPVVPFEPETCFTQSSTFRESGSVTLLRATCTRILIPNASLEVSFGSGWLCDSDAHSGRVSGNDGPRTC